MRVRGRPILLVPREIVENFYKYIPRVVTKSYVFHNYLLLSRVEDVFNRSFRIYNEHGLLVGYDSLMIKDFLIHKDILYLLQGRGVQIIKNITGIIKKFSYHVADYAGETAEHLEEILDDLLQRRKENVASFDSIPTTIFFNSDEGYFYIGTSRGEICKMGDYPIFDKKKIPLDLPDKPITEIIKDRKNMLILQGEKVELNEPSLSPYVLSKSNIYFTGPKNETIKIDNGGKTIKRAFLKKNNIFVLYDDESFGFYKILRAKEIQRDSKTLKDVYKIKDAILVEGRLYVAGQYADGENFVGFLSLYNKKIHNVLKTKRIYFDSLGIDPDYLFVGFSTSSFGIALIPMELVNMAPKIDEPYNELEEFQYSLYNLPMKVQEIHPGFNVIYIFGGDYHNKLLIISGEFSKLRKSTDEDLQMKLPEELDYEEGY